MVSSTFFNGRFVAESSFDGATSVTNLAFDSLAILQAMRTTKNLPALDTEREEKDNDYGRDGLLGIAILRQIYGRCYL